MVALLALSVRDASNASANSEVMKLMSAVMVFWQSPEQISSVLKMALIMSVILVYMIAAAGNGSSLNVSMNTWQRKVGLS